jgi:hypothetical protein
MFAPIEDISDMQNREITPDDYERLSRLGSSATKRLRGPAFFAGFFFAGRVFAGRVFEFFCSRFFFSAGLVSRGFFRGAFFASVLEKIKKWKEITKNNKQYKTNKEKQRKRKNTKEKERTKKEKVRICSRGFFRKGFGKNEKMKEIKQKRIHNTNKQKKNQ